MTPPTSPTPRPAPASRATFDLDDDVNDGTPRRQQHDGFSNLSNGVARTVTETADAAYRLSTIDRTGATTSTVHRHAGGFDTGDHLVSTVTLAEARRSPARSPTRARWAHDRQGHGAQRRPGLHLHQDRHRLTGFTLDSTTTPMTAARRHPQHDVFNNLSPAPLSRDRDGDAVTGYRPDRTWAATRRGTGADAARAVATGGRPSPWPTASGHLHLHQHQARGRSRSSRTRCPTAPRTSPTPRPAPGSRASPSMTTGSTTASSATSSTRRSSTTSSPAPTA